MGRPRAREKFKYSAVLVLLAVLLATPAVIVGLFPWIAGMSTQVGPVSAAVLSVVIFWAAYVIDGPVERMVNTYSRQGIMGKIASTAISMAIYTVGYSLIVDSVTYAFLQALIVHLVYVLLVPGIRAFEKNHEPAPERTRRPSPWRPAR